MDNLNSNQGNSLTGLNLINEENVDSVIEREGSNAVVSDELLTEETQYEDLTDNSNINNMNSSDANSYNIADDKEEDLDEEEAKETNGKNGFVEELLDWFKSICIGLIIGVLVVVFVIQRSNVHGDSMNQTLIDGDVILAEKISTYFNNFDRGDIVILDGKDMEGYMREEYLIKRVIGLPGETIKFEDGNVYIKQVGASEFMKLEEPYLVPGTTTNVSPHGIENGYDCITLGEDEYFCLGDNRGVSNDSRNLGPFTSNRIKGVAVFRVYPFDSISTL